MLPFLVPLLFTCYIQSVLKLKKKSGAKGLRMIGALPPAPSVRLHDVHGDFRSVVSVMSKGGISAMGLCVHVPICREEVPCSRENREVHNSRLV